MKFLRNISLMIICILGVLIASEIRLDGFYSAYDTTSIEGDTVYYNEYTLKFTNDSVSLIYSASMRFSGSYGIPMIQSNEGCGSYLYKGSYSVNNQSLSLELNLKEANKIIGLDSIYIDSLEIKSNTKLESLKKQRTYNWWLK